MVDNDDDADRIGHLRWLVRGSSWYPLKLLVGVWFSGGRLVLLSVLRLLVMSRSTCFSRAAGQDY